MYRIATDNETIRTFAKLQAAKAWLMGLQQASPKVAAYIERFVGDSPGDPGDPTDPDMWVKQWHG